MFKRKKIKNIKVDDDLLLRANIAQGIKILYLDRPVLFYPENKHYERLKDVFSQISKNIRDLKPKKPRMLVISGDHLDYEILTDEMIQSIIDYLEFLLYLPPPKSLFSKWRKSVELGKMKVPTMSYILNSLLTYKLPDYWKGKMDLYAAISKSILDIMNETSSNKKIVEITDKLKEKTSKTIDKKVSDEYKEKLIKWLNLGLIV